MPGGSFSDHSETDSHFFIYAGPLHKYLVNMDAILVGMIVFSAACYAGYRAVQFLKVSKDTKSCSSDCGCSSSRNAPALNDRIGVSR